MRITTKNQVALSLELIESRVDRLRSQLGCLGQERDTQGSDFWYLRLGTDELEIPNTRPIAIGFDDRLNDLTEAEIKDFSTAKDSEIYRHYLDRVSTEQPVMYLLYPSSEESGRVAFILPQEGGLKQRDIKVFELGSRELATRLERFKIVPVAQNILCSVPLVERVFYDPIETAKDLAKELATVAKRIEQIIPKVYRPEQKNGYLNKLLASFKDELLPFLELEAKTDEDYSFADIYAQTVAYSLFTARVFSHLKWQKELQVDPTVKQPLFDRETAWEQLPETNPFLRQLFKDISKQKAEDLGDGLITEIANIFGILRAAKMEAILSDFSQTGNRDDIIIHFYEPFLAAYNPNLKKNRGVYYTPESVVSYMVRSVDILLKDKFHKPLGLADPDVMILDPATGTGTYLLWIFQLVEKRFKGKEGEESYRLIKERFGDMSWTQYVRDHLLPRVAGFELLVSPYAIAHLKLSLFLQESGYEFDPNQRLKVYLTNTLDNTPYKPEFPSSEFVSNEANEAAIVKNEDPVMVVVGNPPYSCDSNNRGEWIEKLMEDYKVNVRKEETQIQALSNDYIKFIRFAQWKIDSNSCGILSFVTGHGYIDGPLARDMRGALNKSFHEISILDLNGSIRKVRNTIQDGDRDDPVFNIQQGTAITFAIKRSDFDHHSAPKINHYEIFGSENKKDDYLLENDVRSTHWNSINPQAPYFYFVKSQDKSSQDNLLAYEYENFTCLTEIFGTGNRSIDKEKLWATGFATQQDEFAISFDSNEIVNKVSDLLNSDTEDDLRTKYKLCTTNQWNYKKSKQQLKNILLKNKIKPCLFRPFDIRQTIFDRNIVTVLRSKVMSQMQDDNTALIVSRVVNDAMFAHSFVSNIPVDKICVSSKTSTNAYVFPLYLYSQTNIESSMGIVRRPNLSQLFLRDISIALRYTPTPEAIFNYIYAILHSHEYRSRYAEFLKRDFPRIPMTRNVDLFRQLGELGEQLVNLHLMKSPILDQTSSPFIDNGGGCIVQHPPKYEGGKVVINKQKDGFMDVPEDVWNFHVGGYQVCQKWLKDRKGRTLSQDDIGHYQKIVVALGQSIELMAKIDAAIPNWPLDAEYN